jgi:hypothetical protein
MPDPTIHNVHPTVLLTQDLANSTLQTTGTQELQLFANFPKGSCVIDAWVEVETEAGAASTGTLFHETGTTEVAIKGSMDFDTAALLNGLSAGGHAAISADGDIKVRKTGTGTALVLSVMCLVIRPDMNA